MKSIFGGKTSILLFSLAAVVILIILASGLGQVKFSAPMWVSADNVYTLNTTGDAESTTPKWFGYVFIILIIIMFLLFLGPIRPQTTPSLIKRLLLFSAAMFLFMIVMGRFARGSPFLTGEFDPAVTSGRVETPMPTEPIVAPEARAGWVFWVTTIIVFVASAVAVFLLNRFLGRWWKPKELDGIAEIARSTLKELSAEKPSKNAIVRCYARMTAAVNENRGLSRNQSMTPTEFVAELEKAGLPRDAVQGLTRVFERVRYGGQDVDVPEIKEAKRHLTSILTVFKAQG